LRGKSRALTLRSVERGHTMESWDIVEWGKPLQHCVREAPVPTGTQVLVRVTHCGVCHTDVHVRQGYFDLGGGQRLPLGPRGSPLPLTPGHEVVGEVAAAGEGADNVHRGDRVLVNPWTGCGHCELCRSDHDNLCANSRSLGVSLQGGYASHVIVPHPKYLVDIAGLDPALAAPLACSGVTTYRAARKLLPIDPAEWVAVIGCGGLGLAAISALRALGHARVLACDIDARKTQAALEWGAEAACTIGAEPAKEMASAVGGPVYGILDFVGSDATFALSQSSLRKGGRYVVCGLFGGQLQVSSTLLALRELSVQGSLVGSPQDLRELVALAQAGELRLGNVTCRPLADAEAALQDLTAGRVIGRQVLVCSQRQLPA
jgi:D-arabinose 1-dehydrogenase-like Zn-dependent alcohol dehydrogenase